MASHVSTEPNKIALGAGFGIAVLWILMALWCFKAALTGYGDDRSDYGLIWAIVGVLLMGAGAAAGFGTYWHQIVLKKRYAEHQH
jgi:hypothetical protein